jgi:hypothetical protein
MTGHLSPEVPCVGILARTDPNEQESVVLRPDLDAAILHQGDAWRGGLVAIRDCQECDSM